MPVDAKKATIWTNVHITAAFICSCLPFLKPLFIQVASATQYISQYARSLLSLRSRHSETIPEDENDLRTKGDDSASGDTSIRMDNYKGRAWIPPNPQEYQNITEAQGPSKFDTPATQSTPGVIKVQSAFHVAWGGLLLWQMNWIRGVVRCSLLSLFRWLKGFKIVCSTVALLL